MPQASHCESFLRNHSLKEHIAGTEQDHELVPYLYEYFDIICSFLLVGGYIYASDAHVKALIDTHSHKKY